MSTLEADDSRTGEDSFVGGTPVVQKKVSADNFTLEVAIVNSIWFYIFV